MTNPLNPNPTARADFKRFMAALQDFLYKAGWYTQSYYVAQKSVTYAQVEKYLVTHCYDGLEAKRIIARIKRKLKII